MPVAPFVPGLPGVRAQVSSSQRLIFKGGKVPEFLPLGRLIDGVNSRDPSNSPVTTLQAGLLMGKITSTGLYAPSIMGTLANAFSSPGVTMTVSAAVATELARRVGNSGTFTLVGPATANGPSQVVTITYSAVNTSTGNITVTDPGVSFVAGSFVGPTDGSQNMLTFIPDGYGISAVDSDGTTNITNQFPLVPVGGVIISANLINWPTDTTLQAFIVGKLNSAAGGKFEFDHVY